MDDLKVMPARRGTREEVTEELRLVLMDAFVRGGWTWEGLLDSVNAKLRERGEKQLANETALKRIVDPDYASKVRASTALWAIRDALGIGEMKDYRVVTNPLLRELVDELEWADEDQVRAILALLRARRKDEEDDEAPQGPPTPPHPADKSRR